MDPVDHAAFRAAFREALGEERYRKFVASGVGPRLRFWQEVELRDFFEAHPAMRLDDVQLEAALRICELHDLMLQSESVEVFMGCVDYSAAYTRVRRASFPHAAADVVSSEGRRDMPPVVEVAYCPECRRVRAEWMRAEEARRAQSRR